jgi:hypothetical protein
MAMAIRDRNTGRGRAGGGSRTNRHASPVDGGRVAMFEVERRTYEEHLPELLGSVGKFVLILDEKIDGPFDTYAAALEAGYERHGVRPFLVKQVSDAEPIQYFSRDLP